MPTTRGSEEKNASAPRCNCLDALSLGSALDHIVNAAGRHELIEYVEEFFGTLTSTCVYPRELIKRALVLNASAVVLAHNHPSGKPEPSMADEAVTRSVRQALALIDVRTLDHIVVGGGQSVSFAERGLL